MPSHYNEIDFKKDIKEIVKTKKTHAASLKFFTKNEKTSTLLNR